MNKTLITRARRCALMSCLLFAAHAGEAQFVEISVEIEVISYRSDRTNAEAAARPRIVSVICTTAANNWRVENDWPRNGVHKWFFDGTNIYQSTQITQELPPETQEKMKK